MADDTSASPQATPPAPTYSLMGQYIRDLSFENPGAPASIMIGGAQPKFNVGINVGVKKQTDEVYGVEITLNAKADRDGTVLFQVELIYGGVYRVKDVPEQQLPALLMVECPRLLFPFARQLLASVTQQGGFPPLVMEPVDFGQIYLQNLRAMQQAQQNAPQGGTPPMPN